ncbi:MAG: hypothetical protein ACYCYF_01260 [Anaerolineae bacterium]
MSKSVWFLAGFLFALGVGIAVILGPLSESTAAPTIPAPIASNGVSQSGTPATQAPAASIALRWTREGDSLAARCGALEIDGRSQVHYTPCGQSPRAALLTTVELDEFRTYLSTHAAFDYAVQAPAGFASAAIRLRLNGAGTHEATVQEQTAVAEFAERVFARLLADEARAELLASIRLDVMIDRGVAIEAIEIRSVDPVTWPDSCLGLHEQGKFCGQVATEGYRVVLSVEDETLEYRADRYGNIALETGHPAGMTLPPLNP